MINSAKKGVIKKPIITLTISTSAKLFTTEVLFRHAGSMANSDIFPTQTLYIFSFNLSITHLC